MRRLAILAGVLALGAVLAACGAEAPGGSVVKVVRQGDGWQLLRNGQPYTIKGAGGGGSKKLLAECGANSFRTWGADNIRDQLDEAQRLGLSVTVGIWLGHKEHGFDWHDRKAVADQLERARRNVLQYKDHPALLIWALGNEMESGGLGDDPALWTAINDMAEMVHKLDPNHPTMTVVAEIGGNTVRNIHKYCPAIDIVGINTYAGAASIPERYKKAGGTKPYLLTEFGPPGTWEYWKKTPWGAMEEMTSTEKVEWYTKPYRANVIENAGQCLGAYAFTWGNKQEASATWFGMLLPDGSKLPVVDAMQELWSGKPAPDPCPSVQPLKADGPRQLEPGAPLTVNLAAKGAGPLKVEWLLTGEPKSYNTGGANEAAPPVYRQAILKADEHHAELKMPAAPGRYRLFAYVRNNHGGAGVANLALLVKTPAAGQAAGGAWKGVPVYDEAGGKALWIPSGYMGNNGAIKMAQDCTENPHSGNTCIKAEYTAGDNWGGVVWQHPADDWGDKPGGWDLSGASRLSFWARGEKGGETVSFSFGLLDRKSRFYDTANGKLGDVRLTKEWKEYSIDLAGKDLSCIKTGFCWVVAAKGEPVTFYLDDIRYEGIDQATPAKAPAVAAPGKKATLPLAVYDEAGRENVPWIPSGYMGNAGAIRMSEECADNPHAGKTCLKVEYTAGDNWAGVVWQSPANDWKGEQAGGWDVTGAKKLTFWARGEKGGEVVSFSYGLLGRDVKYFDTANGKLGDVKLTKEWKEYSIDVAGKDLTRIKTGFCWVVAGKGEPVTFYLDDVRWE